MLIDGLDEVPSDKREAMLEAMARLVESYPNSHYVISARPTALKEWQTWQEWVKLASLQEVALQEMDTGQIEAFVDHWFRAVGEIGTLSDADRALLPTLPAPLKYQLRQRRVLRQLATTPLLCAMLCALYRERQQELPAERITLYQRCGEMLLSGREEIRKITLGPEYPNLSDPQRWSLLRVFAAWLLRNGLTEVETERVAEQFEVHLKRFGWQGTGEGARAYFVERTGLLTEPVESKKGSGGTIAFTHRTFQEFLAAQQFVEEASQGELLAHATEAGWRETIILAAGLGNLSWREEMLCRLLGEADTISEPDICRHFHLLALACLETARQEGVGLELQERVLGNAKTYFPPQDMADAELLAKVGEAAIPLLKPTANQSDKVAAACVWALALIGGTGAVQVLGSYAEKSNARTIYQGRNLLIELSQAWDAFDRDRYVGEVLARCESLIFSHLDDLTPLKALTNLVALDLSQSGVNDLTPLQSLASLQWLSLSRSGVSDLTPLQGLINLRTLYLSQSGVNDLAPLQHLANLRYLDLSQSGVSDLTPLQTLTNLQRLSLSQSKVSVLTPLQSLTNLVSLELRQSEVSDLTSLRSLSNLQVLDLRQSAVNDLAPLQSLGNLQELNLSRDQLSLVPQWLEKRGIITVTG